MYVHVPTHNLAHAWRFSWFRVEWFSAGGEVCIYMCVCEQVEKQRAGKCVRGFEVVFSFHFLRAYHQTLNTDDLESRERGKRWNQSGYLTPLTLPVPLFHQ